MREPHMNEVDAALVARAKAGDDSAFSALVARHGDKVYRLAFRVTRNEARAQDAMQDVFVQVFRELGRLQDGGAFSTWLHRVTVNASLMRIRAERRYRREDPSLWYTEDGEVFEPADEGATPVDEDVSNRELAREAAATLATLRESFRTVFVLRELEDLTTTQTAQRLSITEAMVKTRLFRARRALRRALQKRWEPEQIRQSA
ncbi:MAG: sigma-70 family RNA polymerase sigma factor [Polyangiales bacterium]